MSSRGSPPARTAQRCESRTCCGIKSRGVTRSSPGALQLRASTKPSERAHASAAPARHRHGPQHLRNRRSPGTASPRAEAPPTCVAAGCRGAGQPRTTGEAGEPPPVPAPPALRGAAAAQPLPPGPALGAVRVRPRLQPLPPGPAARGSAVRLGSSRRPLQSLCLKAPVLKASLQVFVFSPSLKEEVPAPQRETAAS